MKKLILMALLTNLSIFNLAQAQDELKNEAQDRVENRASDIKAQREGKIQGQIDSLKLGFSNEISRIRDAFAANMNSKVIDASPILITHGNMTVGGPDRAEVSLIILDSRFSIKLADNTICSFELSYRHNGTNSSLGNHQADCVTNDGRKFTKFYDWSGRVGDRSESFLYLWKKN